jgi:sigma-B regulation protein RsbU (phosphoserine phosphatase)
LNSLASKLTFYILSLTLLILGVTFFVMYRFNSAEVTHHAEKYAMSLLKNTVSDVAWDFRDVEHIMAANEQQVRSVVSTPDSAMTVIADLVAQENLIVGASVAFEPNFYQGRGAHFMLYANRDSLGRLHQRVISDADNYDYHNMAWYADAKSCGHGVWSEPYYDKGGGDILMTTYSIPLKDAEGHFYGVFTADVSLVELVNEINGLRAFPDDYTFVLTGKGNYVAHSSWTDDNNDIDLATSINNDVLGDIVVKMTHGETGLTKIVADGERLLVCYAPLSISDWSIGYACPYSSILSSLNNFTFSAEGLLLLVLVLLIFAMRWTIKHQVIPVERAKQRMSGELLVARDIQMTLIPAVGRSDEYPQLDVCAMIRPAKEVGGDLYDCIFRNGKLFFTIADVSGKGVPAALIMVTARAHFRMMCQSSDDAGTIVSWLNNVLAEDNDANMFVTMFVGVLDLRTNELNFCNAGHNPALVADGSGCHFMDVLANLPVGVMKDFDYQSQRLTISPDDVLLFYTDGLNEAENARHEMLGCDVVIDRLADCRRGSAESIVESVVGEVEGFVDGAEQSDDLTLFCLKLNHSLEMKNNIDELSRLPEFVDELCAPLTLPAERIGMLNLALEEALANVVNYAYPKGETGTARLVAELLDDSIRFMLVDSGTPFDPTTAATPDITLPLEERPVGGLGILLIRKIMSEVSYRRNGKFNELQMLFPLTADATDAEPVA